MKLPALSLADGAAWEQRLVAAFERGPHAVEIVRRCVDVVELLAVAGSGVGRVALVSTAVRRLDADAVDRLAAVGVVVVGVVPRGDVEAEHRCRVAGIDVVLPDDAEPEVAAAVVVEAVRSPGEGSDAAPRRRDRAFGDPSAAMPVAPGGVDGPGPPPAPVERRGRVVAVWGPTGAPGRTTVALAVADELAQLGFGTLVVDADVYGGTLASVIGLLDEAPGLAAACRQATGARLDAAGLAALCWQVSPRLRALTGIPLASRWPELRPAGVAAVLGAARALADFTVVDCGFCLETDEELSFDTVAPRRNGATLAVLDEADLVLAVGGADPIGVQRLVRGLAELRDAEVTAPAWVVLNRMRGAAVPGDSRAQLADALERFAGRSTAAFLPFEPALDRALAGGRLLREVAPGSPLRRSVVELAATVGGVRAPRERGRRHGA